MIITFDIETVPTNDAEVIAQFKADADKEKLSIKAPSNYKDEAKIAEYVAAKSAEIDAGVADNIAKTSFSGLYGRVACICWQFEDGPVHTTLATDSEEEAIHRFYTSITTETQLEIHKGFAQVDLTFCGHNVVGFDLPFLKHRSIILGIKPPKRLLKAMNAKPWDSCVADTMLMWSSDPHKRGSMDRLCKAFGIPGKGDFDGSMVAETWPIDPEKVIEYCADDVIRTRHIYKRINFMPDEQSFALAA